MGHSWWLPLRGRAAVMWQRRLTNIRTNRKQTDGLHHSVKSHSRRGLNVFSFKRTTNSDVLGTNFTVKVHNDLISAIDHNNLGALVTLDVSSAFDTVDHQTFLIILQQRFSVTNSARNWFSSYFFF